MPTDVVCSYLERKGDPRSPYFYCTRRAAQVRPGQSGCSYDNCRTFRATCDKADILSPDCDPIPIPPAPPATQEPTAMPAHDVEEPTASPAPPHNVGATTTPPAAPEPVIPDPPASSRSSIAWHGPVRDTVRDVDEDTRLIDWARAEIAAGASVLSVARRIGCSDSSLNWQLRKPSKDASSAKAKPAARKHRKLTPLPAPGSSAPAGEPPPSEPAPGPAGENDDDLPWNLRIVISGCKSDLRKTVEAMVDDLVRHFDVEAQVAPLADPFGVDCTPRRCRVCGCTDEHACPGGCSWVEPDLCSACADMPLHPTRELRDALERAGLLPRPETELRELVAGIPEEVIRAYIVEADLAEKLEEFYAGWRRCLEHLRIGPDLVALRDALGAGA